MNQAAPHSPRPAWIGVAGWSIATALLLGLYAPVWVGHVTRTWDRFTFNDDARILIWPFFRYGEPSLFPHDWFADYYLSGLPEGYRLLYTLAGKLGVAIELSEILPYVSALAVVLLLSDVARRLGGNLAAVLASLLVLSSDVFLERAGGGLPRSFAFPLMAMGLHAAVVGHPYRLALGCVLGMAFYPVVAALLGLLLFFVLLVPERFSPVARKEAPRPSWCRTPTTFVGKAGLLGATLLPAIALAWPMGARLHAYGEPITPAMLSQYPEAGEGGRLDREQRPPFLPYFHLVGEHSYRTLVGQGRPILKYPGEFVRQTSQRAALTSGILVSVSAVLFAMRLRRTKAALPILLVGLVSCLGYFMASAVAPRLFLPERYVQYVIPLLVIVVLSVGMGAAGEPGSASVGLGSRALAAAATLATVALVGTRAISWAGVEVVVPREERPLHAYLQTLPKNVLIAGWPVGPLENVPYLARRRVLSNHQLQMPFHTRFTLEVRERVVSCFRAFLSPAKDALCSLRQRQGVTHLVVDRRMNLARDGGYYRPFDTELGRLRSALRDREPWLSAHLDTLAAVKSVGPYAVVDLERVLACTP